MTDTTTGQAARYYAEPCEGCHGAGTSTWDCDGGGHGCRCDDPYDPTGCRCDCVGCTGDDRCGECGGSGFYDPDPADDPADVDDPTTEDEP